MSVLESIIHDLRELPLPKLVEVANFVHRLNENAVEERARILSETHGYLDGDEALVFEEALKNSCRLEAVV